MSETHEQHIEDARGRLADAQRILETVTTSAAAGIATGRDLSDARADVDAATLALEGAQQRAATAEQAAEDDRREQERQAVLDDLDRLGVQAEDAVRTARAAFEKVAAVASELDAAWQVHFAQTQRFGRMPGDSLAAATAAVIWPTLKGNRSHGLEPIRRASQSLTNGQERWEAGDYTRGGNRSQS